MNTPILIKYKEDLTGKDPENLIGGERHVIAPGPKNKIFAAKEGPFFSASAKVRLPNGSYLEPWVDFQPVHHFPEASKKTGKSCTCFIKILNESVSGDVFLEYQVVGGLFTFNSVTLENLLWAIINDERSVLWDNINNKPLTYPPSYHTHDIFTDTYGWGDRIAFSNWVSDQVILGGETLDYEAFTTKVNTVLSELTTLQLTIISQIAEHEAEHNNPHADHKAAVGYRHLQNLATATDTQALEGSRTDLRLTVKGAQDILSDAVEGYSVNLIHQGILPVTRFGNLNFLQPGIIGSFEGSSMIEVHDRYAQVVENDGTYVRLRPGSNGETLALYYDYATNLHSNITTVKLINTNNKYQPAGLDQAYQPARLLDMQGDGFVGFMYPKVISPDLQDVKCFVALTNGTLDASKHNVAEITNPYFTRNDGTHDSFNTAYTTTALVGDRLYVIHYVADAVSVIEDGAVVDNTTPELCIGYIALTDILAGGLVSMTQLKTWSSTFLREARVSDNITLVDQLIGSEGELNFIDYIGEKPVSARYRVYPGVSAKLADNANGTLTLTSDVTIDIVGPNNTESVHYPYRLLIDPVAKTAMMLDDLYPVVLTDTTASEIGFATPADRTNGSNLDFINLRGFKDASGDTHGSRLITKKGYSVATERSGESNQGMYLNLQSIAGFSSINDYWLDPGSHAVTAVARFDDEIPYGSVVTGDVCLPVLFPNNQLGAYANTRYVTQPLVGEPDFTYDLLGYDQLTGYAPSKDRVAPDHTTPTRSLITEINGEAVTTHCRVIADNLTAGSAEIDYRLVESGAISVSDDDLQTQTQRLIDEVGITPTALRCQLFVPADTDIPLLLKVIGYLPVDDTGVVISFCVVATVTYEGSREGVLSDWAANTDDILYTTHQTGGSAFGDYLKSTGMISYRVEDDYILAIGGSVCFERHQPIHYLKLTAGRISDNPHRVDLVEPTADRLTNVPFALPGKGFYIVCADDALDHPLSPVGTGFTGPCAIVVAEQGEVFDDLLNWTVTDKPRMVLLSQQSAPGWLLNFAEEIPIILNGHEYTLPITTVDLQDVDDNPDNKTFYVYVETIDTTTARYRLSTTELTAEVNRMYVGFVKTSSTQISEVNITKRSGLNKYQISTTKAGSSIPVSTGLPFQRGSWSQA